MTESELAEVLALLDRRYAADRNGRLAAPDAPLVAFVRSEWGVAWRLRADLAQEQVVAVARLAGREGAAASPASASGPPDRLGAIERVLGTEAAPLALVARRAPGASQLDLVAPSHGDASDRIAELWLFR